MKTTITKTGENEVTIRAFDPASREEICWVFWVPTNGGYVREGVNHSGHDKQICVGLSNRGNTLSADSGDELLALIRAEWSAYRKWAVAA